MNLLDKQYDRRSEEKAELNLTNAENQIATLSQYTKFLKQKNYEKAKEHINEADSLESDIEKVWELLHRNSHQRSAVPPASPGTADRTLYAAGSNTKLNSSWSLSLVFCLMMPLLLSYISGLRSLKHTI